jgi:hypothetical protein
MRCSSGRVNYSGCHTSGELVTMLTGLGEEEIMQNLWRDV